MARFHSHLEISLGGRFEEKWRAEVRTSGHGASCVH